MVEKTCDIKAIDRQLIIDARTWAIEFLQELINEVFIFNNIENRARTHG